VKKWEKAMNRTSRKIIDREKLDKDLLAIFREFDKRLSDDLRRKLKAM
jgi:hypothetical protein